MFGSRFKGALMRSSEWCQDAALVRQFIDGLRGCLGLDPYPKKADGQNSRRESEAKFAVWMYGLEQYSDENSRGSVER